MLVAVAEHGGVGAGARAIGVAQPNASRALRRLERQLKVRLVRRGARGSTLTADGGLVVDWARAVVEANQRLLAGVAALAAPAAPTVTVAASQTIAEDLLPRWLAALRRENPDVSVALSVGNSAEVGLRVNLGGVIGFVESPQLPTTLGVPVESQEVSRDRLVVVVSPEHEWVRRTRPITLDEVAHTRLVVREPGSGTRVSFEQALGPMSLVSPALELTSNAAVRVAVAAGIGPAVLSEHAVQAAVAAGELRAVMVEGLMVERPLRAVWSRLAELPAPARRLVQLATAIEAGRTEASGPMIDPGWGL